MKKYRGSSSREGRESKNKDLGRRESKTQGKSKNGVSLRQFSKMMQQKLAITYLVILLALFALIVKIYLIQKNSREYNQRVLMQQRYDSRDIPYRRGDILDRNGIFLATSNKVYNVIIDANQINSKQEYYLDPTVKLLKEVFGDSEEEIRALLVDKSDSRYIKYKKEVSFEERTRFEERREEINKGFKEEKSRQKVIGVWFEESYKRIYPYNSLACNVIGFTNEEGKMANGGVEQYYDEELTGIMGREYGYLNEESNLERVIKSAEGGHSIALTIDSNIQKIVEKHIAEWEAEIGSKISACIIMNPDNGEILAMASSRTFNLNKPRELELYYTQGEIEMMDDIEKSNAFSEIWRNFCVNDTFEPGSPSKVFTVAAAMEEGIIHGEENYYCDGYQRVGGHDIHCAIRSGHGMVTVTEAVARSCNDMMMQLVSSLGTEKFCKAQQLFGFGSYSGIDLPGEPDTSGLVHSVDNMSAVDLATNSFGQNYNCNMAQMAAAFCSVINGGSYYEPHVVKKIFNAQGTLIKNIEPKLVRETVSPSTSDFLRKAMRIAVEQGTGQSAKVEGYDVGGKTGTSEKLPRGNGKYLVSFAGFAPVDDPEVFCYVVVDEPATEDQARSSYAGDLFARIMRDVMPYMSIFPKEGYEAGEEVQESDAQESGQETADESAADLSHGEEESPEGSENESSEAGNEGEDERGQNTGGEGRSFPTKPSSQSDTQESSAGNKVYETDEYIEFDNLRIEPSESLPEGSAQGGSKKSTKEAAGESGSESTRESVKESTKEGAKQGTKESVKQSTKESVKPTEESANKKTKKSSEATAETRKKTN
ncbi:MAG: penicillin-binding transpeptidase domain-containing protein [Johnsonella sp.]|nr:penicillin-binding transpeptidase domain-containing protein [Johnsonella sp.]